MCNAQPGLRCSSYSEHTLNVTQARHDKQATALKEYEEKWKDSLAKPESELSKSDVIKQHKHARLVEDFEEVKQKLTVADFEHKASPAGQKQLEAELEEAKAAGDSKKVTELETTIKHASAYRKWQRDNHRDLKTIEETDGLEAAKDEADRRIAEIEKLDAERAKQKEELDNQLKTLKTEEEADAEAEKAHAEGRKVLEKRELRKLRNRRHRRIMLITAAATAVLAFALITSAASGKKSQLLSYAKSFAMRQGMQHGKKVLTEKFGKKPVAAPKGDKKPVATKAAEKVAPAKTTEKPAEIPYENTPPAPRAERDILNLDK